MTSTAWNDAEESALQGMPWPAQILYLRCLRRYMDYSTGVVGVRRRISWQMIRETLYVEPHQGLIDSGLPSLAKVRRLMDWLIRAGLAVDQGTKERGEAIVFFLPLADRDESVQKNPGKNPARTRQGNVGNEESTEVTDFNVLCRDHYDNPGKNPARVEWAKPGTPPESGIRKEEDNPPSPPSRPVGGQPSAPVFVLPFSIDPGIWEEFEQHRKAIRKPLNNQSRAKNSAVLAPLTHEQQQATVNTTIANRWVGLFPPKVNGHATDRSTPGQRFRAAAEASLAEHWDDPDPAGFRRS